MSDKVREFYDQHPYPPPITELKNYQQKWQDESRRRADFHLFWPAKQYHEEMKILVAGCGTSQAAKYAIRHPSARVVGIDISSTSIKYTRDLKKEYNLENLTLQQLPLERAYELEMSFDKIICTGVLHHLSDPLHGLTVLKSTLAPDGAIHLMVYAPHGRYGIYMLQRYANLVGVGESEKEINDFANTLMFLADDHPLAPILGASPDFRTPAGLADALLNPLDRAYSVPDMMEVISAAGLKFGRWVKQAPYIPQCGRFAATSHVVLLEQLSPAEQYAAMELLRGTMLRHSSVIYRDDYPHEQNPINLESDHWLEFVPLRTHGSLCIKQDPPPGTAAVLINQEHSYPDLVLPIDQTQLQIYEAIDNEKTVGTIINSIRSASNLEGVKTTTQRFFQQLWWFDQVVFDTSMATKAQNTS